MPCVTLVVLGKTVAYSIPIVKDSDKWVANEHRLTYTILMYKYPVSLKLVHVPHVLY